MQQWGKEYVLEGVHIILFLGDPEAYLNNGQAPLVLLLFTQAG